MVDRLNLQIRFVHHAYYSHKYPSRLT
jgi:hypothetical protein